jgi:hypothetical protein
MAARDGELGKAMAKVPFQGRHEHALIVVAKYAIENNRVKEPYLRKLRSPFKIVAAS